MPDFALQLSEIYPRTDLITTERPLLTASLQDRVQSIVFFDKVLYSNVSITPQYWDGKIDATNKERTYDVPGLGEGDVFDGVATFFSHVLLWRGSRLLWCDVADMTLWLPVANTIVSLNATSQNDFVQPAPGAISEYVYFQFPPTNLITGTPVRVSNLPEVSYWTVEEVAPFSLQTYAIESMTRERGSGPENQELVYAEQKAKVFVELNQVLPALEESFVHPESDTSNEIVLKITDQSSPILDYVIFLADETLDLDQTATPANATIDVTMELEEAKLVTVGDIVSIDILQTQGRELFDVDFIDYAIPGQATPSDPFLATVRLRRGADNPQTGVNEIAGRQPWTTVIGTSGKPGGIIMSYQRWIEVQSVESSFNIFANETTTAVDTSLDVDDGSGGSVFAQIRDNALIQNLATNELMLVTPVPTSDTLTVVRGHNGSTAAVITDGDTLLVRNVALIPFGVDLVERYAVKLKTLGLTGRIADGVTVPAGTTFFTVDANESGEIENVEPSVVGVIYNFVQIGEIGYLLKERSIQSVQYVGLDQGVFFVRTELSADGMIGRHAFVQLNDDSVAVLGNRDLYLYRGGRDYTPIARGYTIKLFRELDVDRRDEIVLQHVEEAREIWVIYPALLDGLSVRKVFIYNYEDKSCVTDDYFSDDLRLTAMTQAKPFELVTWNDLVGDWTAQQLSWGDYDGTGIDKRIIIGAFEATNSEGKIPNGCEIMERNTDLYFLETTNFDRFGKGYTGTIEFADEDWGDERRFKYTDETHFTFDFEEPTAENHPLYLYVSIGARDSSDGDFRWSSEQKIDITGSGKQISKLNIRMSGRYIRLRLRSDQKGALWQVSKIMMYARMGGYE